MIRADNYTINDDVGRCINWIMQMGRINTYIISFVLFITPLFAQNNVGVPDWVEALTIENTDDFYYGIGLSDESSEKADAQAYLRIAQHISVSVNAEDKSTVKENLFGIFDFWSQSRSVKTDVDLAGIPITAQWHDSALHYSLIKIRKEDYVALKKRALEEEAEISTSKLKSETKIKKAKLMTDTELERTKLANETMIEKARIERDEVLNTAKQNRQLEPQKAGNSSSFYNYDDEARKELAKLEAMKKKRLATETRRIKKLSRMSDHQQFTRITPPRNLINFRNAELLKKTHQVAVGLGVDPFTIRNLNYSYHLWYTETSFKLDFVDNQLDWQEASIRMQVLPLTGGYYRTSIGIGVVEYLSRVAKTDSKLWRPNYSPVLAGNIAIPHLLNSYLSFYGDYRKVSLGLNSFLFFNSTHDRFNFITQIDFIIDEDYLNRFEEDVIFSAGFQFKTIDALNTTLSYEDHEIFVLRFDYEF